jgi:thiol-disulfide isomerase/thioredoxin
MANTKQQASAARRREQQRQQRLQQQRQQGRARSRAKHGRRSHSLGIIVGVLIAVALLVIGFIVFSRLNTGTSGTTADTNPTSNPQVLKQVTSVSPSVYDTVGTGGVTNPLNVTKNQPLLKGDGGRPVFFYAGAEYCPYCAAERWGMITALSRFGTFSNVSLIHSSESDIPTFSFYKSTFTSQYVDFVPVEAQGQAVNGGQPPVLQAPTAEQEKLVSTYNAPPYVSQSAAGSIPFVDIGNQYILSGASYSPTLLQASDQKTISSQLSDPTSDITKSIIGTANYLTAGICKITNQQPGSVCNSNAIQTIEKGIGSVSTGGSQLGSIAAPAIADLRRID